MKETRTDLPKVDSRLIKIEDGFNVREDYGDINELANSIRENGVIVPVRGFRDGDHVILTDGHRRISACRILENEGMEVRVPVMIVRKPTMESRLVEMFISNTGKQLTPLENAEVIRRLIQYNFTPKEISQKLGITEASVSNMRLLADVPQAVKKDIKENVITSTLVVNMIRSNKGMTMGEIVTNLTTLTTEAKATGKKVTKKTVDANSGSINSLSLLKKFMNNTGEANVANKDLYSFCDQLINNTLTEANIVAIFGEVNDSDTTTEME